MILINLINLIIFFNHSARLIRLQIILINKLALFLCHIEPSLVLNGIIVDLLVELYLNDLIFYFRKCW